MGWRAGRWWLAGRFLPARVAVEYGYGKNTTTPRAHLVCSGAPVPQIGLSGTPSFTRAHGLGTRVYCIIPSRFFTLHITSNSRTSSL